MKGIYGYGRYDDDPEHIGCPRATSDMSPCVARDGSTALTVGGLCVTCGDDPANLLTELVRAVTAPDPLITEGIRRAKEWQQLDPDERVRIVDRLYREVMEANAARTEGDRVGDEG